jgi:hypothetical protein
VEVTLILYMDKPSIPSEGTKRSTKHWFWLEVWRIERVEVHLLQQFSPWPVLLEPLPSPSIHPSFRLSSILTPPFWSALPRHQDPLMLYLV